MSTSAGKKSLKRKNIKRESQAAQKKIMNQYFQNLIVNHQLIASCRRIFASFVLTVASFCIAANAQTVQPLKFEPSGINGAGFQNGVAVSPFDSNIVLSAADVAGIFYSNSGGDTWQPTNGWVTQDEQLKIASIVFSKKDKNKVYAGVGTRVGGGGFVVSNDAGKTWQLVSTTAQFSGNNSRGDGGTPSPHPRATGSLIALDENKNIIYAATYKNGVMRSGDGGKTWEKLDLAGKYLRSLAIDPMNPKVLYAAAYDNQVWKTSDADGNGKFALLENSPKKVEELAVIGLTVYAAASEKGIFKSADGGNSWENLNNDGINSANVIWISIDGYVDKATGQNVVYAGNMQPLARSNAFAQNDDEDGTPAVGRKNNRTAAGGSNTANVEELRAQRRAQRQQERRQARQGNQSQGDAAKGNADGGKNQNADAAANQNAVGNPRRNSLLLGSAVVSKDGGKTWNWLGGDRSKVHPNIGDAKGEAWWLLEKREEVAFGNRNFVAAQIAVDRQNPQRIYVAGRSGMWRSVDGGENWYPVVKGLMVTFNRTILADPNNAGRVFVGNTDWVLMYSTDSMHHIAHNPPPNENHDYTMGMALALGEDNRLYVAGGDRDDNTGGEIYSNPAPTEQQNSNNKWTSEKLKDVAGGARPVGLTVGKDASGATVLLAAVIGDDRNDTTGGIFRKAASGVWQKVEAKAMGGRASTKNASFAWAKNSPIVYLYDRDSGVWRSKDYGATWTNIWNHPSPEEQTGFIVVNPANAAQLYISARDGFYRADDADSAAQLNPRKVETIVRPGAFTVAGQTLYVTGRAGSAAGEKPARLYATARAWEKDAAKQKWTDISDDYYKSIANFPYSLSADKDGTLYIATSGNGAIVGRPIKR